MVEGLQSHLDPLTDKPSFQLLRSLDKVPPNWDQAFPKKDSSYFQPPCVGHRTRSPRMNILAFTHFTNLCLSLY